MILYSALSGERAPFSGDDCRSYECDRKRTLCLEGENQARKLANSLMYETVETIYISEFVSARQTVEIVNTLLCRDVVVDPRLNDVRTGFAFNSSPEWLEELNSTNDDASPEDKWTYRHEDGESLEDVYTRVQDCMQEVLRADKDALIVSHDIVLRMVALQLNEVTPENIWKANVPQYGELRFDEIAQLSSVAV